MIVATGLVGGALVFMMVASGDVGTVRTTDTGITKVLTSAEADQVVSVPGQFQPGADIQHEASHVFEALEGFSGIGAVTVSSDGSTIDVEYASSVISGESITAMLESSGYASPSAPSVDE
jgi:copper chaperone CopZ